MANGAHAEVTTVGWNLVRHLKHCECCDSIVSPYSAEEFCPTTRALIYGLPPAVLREQWIQYLRAYQREWYPWKWVAIFTFDTLVDWNEADDRCGALQYELETLLRHPIGWVVVYLRSEEKVTGFYALIIQADDAKMAATKRRWERVGKGVAHIVPYQANLDAESHVAQAAVEGCEVWMQGLWQEARDYDANYHKSRPRGRGGITIAVPSEERKSAYGS